jgi:hypothetical protein
VHSREDIGQRSACDRGMTQCGTQFATQGVMVVDFTAHAPLLVWSLGAALVALVLALIACVDPELAEIYLGEVPVFVATLAFATLALAAMLTHLGGLAVP